MKTKNMKIMMAAGVATAALVAPVAQVAAAEDTKDNTQNLMSIEMVDTAGDVKFVHIDFVQEYMKDKGYKLTKEGFETLKKAEASFLGEIDEAKLVDAPKVTELKQFEDVELQVVEYLYYDLNEYFDNSKENLEYSFKFIETGDNEPIFVKIDEEGDDKDVLWIEATKRGETVVTVSAHDKETKELKGERKFKVAVVNSSVNHATEIPDYNVALNSKPVTIDFDKHFIDPDGDKISYSVKVDGKTENISFSGNTITMTPKVAGVSKITVTANDGHGGKAIKNFTYTVTGENSVVDDKDKPVDDKDKPVVDKDKPAVDKDKPVVDKDKLEIGDYDITVKPDGSVIFKDKKDGSILTVDKDGNVNKVDKDGNKVDVTAEDIAKFLKNAKELASKVDKTNKEEGETSKLPQTGNSGPATGILGAMFLALASFVGLRKTKI